MITLDELRICKSCGSVFSKKAGVTIITECSQYKDIPVLSKLKLALQKTKKCIWTNWINHKYWALMYQRLNHFWFFQRRMIVFEITCSVYNVVPFRHWIWTITTLRKHHFCIIVNLTNRPTAASAGNCLCIINVHFFTFGLSTTCKELRINSNDFVWN